jgi:hypothetical protein
VNNFTMLYLIRQQMAPFGQQYVFISVDGINTTTLAPAMIQS